MMSLNKTIEKLNEIGFSLSDNLKCRDEKILEFAEKVEEINPGAFIDFINEKTEWNICDCCGMVENSECLIWTEGNEDQKAQKFFNNDFIAVCRECYEKPICVYCDSLEQRKELHFVCDCCNNGMCDECYDSDMEHTNHYHLPLENCESELQKTLIKRVCNSEDPQYICEKCFDKALTTEKIAFIKEDLENLVGTRWTKHSLQKHLHEKYELSETLNDVDESGLVANNAFIMGIFDDYGYMDIYYLLDRNRKIYVTEVNVSYE